ncbi:MAG: hypothetical protein ACE5HQ_11140 [Gemmatimonadota bacterium]
MTHPETILAAVPYGSAPHPGHGLDGGFGLLHLITDPYHVGTGLAIVAAVLLVRRLARRGGSAPVPSRR